MKKRAAAAQRGGCPAKACSPDARPTALWHVWPSRSPLDGKTVGDLAGLFEVLDRFGVDYAVALTADHGGLDLPERAHWSDIDGRLVNVFLKCETSTDGTVHGRRNAMLDDSDVHWHRQIKSAVGGVTASVTGDPATPYQAGVIITAWPLAIVAIAPFVGKLIGRIPDGGRWRVDFAWPDARVAAEYDSVEWHAGRSEMLKDKTRFAGVQEAGWTVVPIIVDDIRRRPARLAQRLDSHLRRPRAAS